MRIIKVVPVFEILALRGHARSSLISLDFLESDWLVKVKKETRENGYSMGHAQKSSRLLVLTKSIVGYGKVEASCLDPRLGNLISELPVAFV